MLSEFKEWNYHEKLVKESEHLSDAEKERVLAGLNQIKEILGEDFLKNAVEMRHPILQYFGNTAPWTRFWLADFGSMLSVVRESPRFAKLQQRLVSSREFQSAISELEVAYRFKKAGFSVEFFPKQGKYEYDLKVQKGDVELCVEVAVIGWSMEELKAWYIMDAFTLPYMTNREIKVAGKIHKILSGPRILEIKKQLDECIQEAKQKQDCVVLSQPGIVDLIICPSSKSDQASKWLRKKGIRSDFEGPPFDVDEIRRVKRTLSEENRQLPEDRPGLIVLHPARIFAKGDLDSFRRLVYKLEDEIYEHPNLVAGALIFSGLRGSSEVGKYSTDFAWSKVTKYQLFGENTLVIRNKYSRFQIKEEIISALIS